MKNIRYQWRPSRVKWNSDIIMWIVNSTHEFIRIPLILSYSVTSPWVWRRHCDIIMNIGNSYSYAHVHSYSMTSPWVWRSHYDITLSMKVLTLHTISILLMIMKVLTLHTFSILLMSMKVLTLHNLSILLMSMKDSHLYTPPLCTIISYATSFIVIHAYKIWTIPFVLSFSYWLEANRRSPFYL